MKVRPPAEWHGKSSGRHLHPVEPWPLFENRLMQVAQRRTRFDPELRTEEPTHGIECPQRLGLPATAVQRQDAKTTESFTERMEGEQTIELGDGRGMTTACQIGVDPRLDRPDAGIAQPGRFGLQSEAHLDIGEGLATPQIERIAQCRRRRGWAAARHLECGPFHQRGEPIGVDLFRRHRQSITTAFEYKHVRNPYA